MPDKVIQPGDFVSATGSDRYAQYLLTARKRWEQGVIATTADVRSTFKRAVSSLGQDIARPGISALRQTHWSGIMASLDQFERNLNDGILQAVRSGIRLSVGQGTAGMHKVARSLLGGTFGTGGIDAMFSGINERATVALITRTGPDGLQLSDRVWNASAHARGAVQSLVQVAVARGEDPRRLARELDRYVLQDARTPQRDATRRLRKLPKVSYPAMRLARTEMQNAFHESHIMANQATPSYLGIFWRLSKEHPVPDICDDYATHNGDGFWPKGQEPTKPHPHCFCYSVPKLEDTQDFLQRLQGWLANPGTQPDLETWYQKDAKPFINLPGRPPGGGPAVATPVTPPTPKPRKPRTPKPKVPQWVTDAKELIAKGINSEADAVALGKIVDDVWWPQEQAANAAAAENLQQLNLERTKAYRAWSDAARNHTGRISDRDELYGKYKDLDRQFNELAAKPYHVARAERLRKILEQVRPFGLAPGDEVEWGRGSKTHVKEMVQKISDHLPTDWLRTSNAWGPLYGETVSRGYYQHRPFAGMVSTLALSKGGRADGWAVALHEMTHRMEYTVGNGKIVRLETEFYRRRTWGEELSWLGPGYGKEEKTRRDNFASPYMGKDYGGGAWEIMTMGTESLFYDSHNMANDPDFRQFVLGVLLGV
jgi:hypothetical protein